MPDLFESEWGWYALKASPKREHLAAELLLRESGIESFCPRIRYTKKTRRGKVRFTEALFPGYLFVRTELKDTYRLLLATSGVTGVVRYGNRVPCVPETFIQELRARLEKDTHDEPEPALRDGQAVTILEGPFKNWQAVVSGLVPARQRVAILLDFLGRTLELQVDPQILLAERDGNENPKVRAFGLQRHPQTGD